MKFWTSTHKDDDKIIAYLNETIYKANPPINEIDKYLIDLNIKDFSSKYFFGIPLRYITQINQQKNKKYIEVLFRGDTEHLKIEDDKQRADIFDFFKQNIPGAIYSTTKQSKLQAVKKPLIAIGVILIIFLWSLYLAIGIEGGNEYDVTGQHYHSIAGIVLALASLGVSKLLLIFGSLLLIASTSLYKKYKTPIIKDNLTIKH
jgi:hypothetical protein